MVRIGGDVGDDSPECGGREPDTDCLCRPRNIDPFALFRPLIFFGSAFIVSRNTYRSSALARTRMWARETRSPKGENKCTDVLIKPETKTFVH